jgi:hypothetical protein
MVLILGLSLTQDLQFTVYCKIAEGM